MKKFCITFAGAVGSSKTPIANYLSGSLNLPIINNDAIRTEVVEDLGKFNEEEYVQRRNERTRSILENGTSFIYDASVDRVWKTLHAWLTQYGYEWFVISMDLSKEFLLKLYQTKGYDESMKILDQFIVDHQNFLNEFNSEVGVHISDDQFGDRLRLAYEATRLFVKK